MIRFAVYLYVYISWQSGTMKDQASNNNILGMGREI